MFADWMWKSYVYPLLRYLTIGPTDMNKVEALITTMTDVLSEYNRRLKLTVPTDDPSLIDAREWSAPTATQEQMETGTNTDRLAMSPLRIAQAIAAQGLKVGSVAGTAKAGEWIPAVDDIPNLPVSKVTGLRDELDSISLMLGDIETALDAINGEVI